MNIESVREIGKDAFVSAAAFTVLCRKITPATAEYITQGFSHSTETLHGLSKLAVAIGDKHAQSAADLGELSLAAIKSGDEQQMVKLHYDFFAAVDQWLQSPIEQGDDLFSSLMQDINEDDDLDV